MSDNDIEPDETQTDPVDVDLEVDEPAEVDESDNQAEDGDDDNPNREAARYRKRLRDTEAERDRFAQQLETVQRSVIEHLAEAEQLRPAALWANTALPDLLAEDGAVDPEKVADAIKSARDVLGVPPPKRNHVPREGTNPTGGRSAHDDMIAAVMGHDR